MDTNWKQLLAEYLHHVLQREFNGERHIGPTQDECLVNVFVNCAAYALLFSGDDTVRYEA